MGNGRRPKWKTTKMEEDQNGRQPKWKTTNMEETVEPQLGYKIHCKVQYMLTFGPKRYQRTTKIQNYVIFEQFEVNYQALFTYFFLNIGKIKKYSLRTQEV